jgi:Flp pilus assembly protein TadG
VFRNHAGVGRLAREDRGQSIVELALCLPLLVFGILGGADLARAYALQIAVQNGSRAGAEAYAITSLGTVAQAQQAAIDEMNRTPTAAATAGMVTVTTTLADGTTACVSISTIATPCYVNVRVQYTWQTIVPWPMVPTGGTFDRSTSIRTFY